MLTPTRCTIACTRTTSLATRRNTVRVSSTSRNGPFATG
ncbi:hypothetical protein PPTG_24777 [Phytophthora nicotianae INRA-310]|uniref:Uncharacterized protein n=1 Tax=Phytophthora nicotianae (strain INRA-310) TaxID=761204 RepID=W2PCL2_PHYN3|nr:hypothetical protein PPTG_24777 [Phytophthora nicotianae INRA-310]ETM97958.1 hypothetical protein PPTG_24777 [Phytophthora nicotianae INRA-310]